jgi:hypothetical protein
VSDKKKESERKALEAARYLDLWEKNLLLMAVKGAAKQPPEGSGGA